MIRSVARVEVDRTSKSSIASGANTVFTNDKKTAYEGSITIKGNAVAQGATTVFVENKPIARQGDIVIAEGAIVSGSTTVFASDMIAAKVNPTSVSKEAARTLRYIANPGAYYNAEAGNNGVKYNYSAVQETISDESKGPSPIPTSGSNDLIPWLTARLAEAAQGQWRERGQGGNPSNGKITNIWAELGFSPYSPWNTDQTAWCMGFVNYALKNCGYRWAPEAAARSIQNNPTRWKATPVSINDAQPGDIAFWSFSHVNFIYTANNGKYTFVGGNQTPSSGSNNNPNDGDLTISWPSGWTPNRGGIAGIWRPSKS